MPVLLGTRYDSVSGSHDVTANLTSFGLQAGDIAVALLSHHDNQDLTPPSGWTDIFEHNTGFGGDDKSGWGGYTVWEDGDDETPTWGVPDSSLHEVLVVGYRAVNQVDANDWDEFNDTQDQAPPAITTTIPNCMILAWYAQDNFSGTPAPPTGYTFVHEKASGTYIAVAAKDTLVDDPATETPGNWTCNSADGDGYSMTVAIQVDLVELHAYTLRYPG